MTNKPSAPKEKDPDWRDSLTWPTRQTMVAKALRVIGRILFWPIMDVDLSGQANVPRGRCILASNHINIFDVISIGLYAPRHPYFMAKRELYKNPILGWIYRSWGAFPVYRGENDAWAIDQAGRILQAEQMLCMFPEGTRSGHRAQLGRGKTGTVRLALAHQAPILPTAVFGTQSLPAGLRRTKVTIQIGEPIDVTAAVGPPPYRYQELRHMTTIVMQHIAAMLPARHRGRYA